MAYTPDLADGHLDLQIAFYDRSAVAGALEGDGAAAIRPLGMPTPLRHLAFSRYIHHRPDLEAAMIAIAEMLVAMAAEGADTAGLSADPERLPDAYCNIIRTILHLPGKFDHVMRLVDVGVEFDCPDAEGLTPVQVAGWEGLPNMMAYLLSLGPDLTHQNGYGGTLLSTIVHGSENCPQRAARDHLGCLSLALEAGVPLPRQAADMAGVPEIAESLADWGERHPETLVLGGQI